MWKLEVYPSLMEAPAIEKYNRSGSLADFLKEAEIEWEGREYQPIVVTVNGQDYPVASWKKKIKSGSIVKIRVVPSGFIGKLIGKILGFIMKLFGGSKKQNARVDTGQARRLESVEASNNQPKLGDVVPEILGTFRKYPDYLVQPHKYYLPNDPRTQILEFHACIGPGEYEIDSQDVRIGNTEFQHLKGDYSQYVIYPPAADLINVTTNTNWHNSPEVGATSSGSTGIDLNSEILNFENTQATSYTYSSGNTITRSNGVWPSGWEVGTIIRVARKLTYGLSYTYLTDVFSRVDYFPGYGPFVSLYGTTLTGDFKHLETIRPSTAKIFIGYSQQNTNTPVYLPTLSLMVLNGYGQQAVLHGTNSVTFYNPSNVGGFSSPSVQLYDPFAGFKITSITPTQITVERVVVPFGASLDYANFTVDTSFQGFTDGTDSGTLSFLASNAFGARSAAFAATPSGELTTTLELDFFFPSGLSIVSDTGSLGSISVSVEVTITDFDTGQAATVNYTFTDATIDQIGYTKTIKLGPTDDGQDSGLFSRPIRPIVSVRRLSEASTSTSVNDKVTWHGLKSLLPNVNSYQNWTTIGVKLQSGGKVSGTSENQINLIAKRKIEPVAGGARRVSSRIEDYVAYIANTAGYTAAQLDIEELTRLGSKWADRGDYFNHIFDETTVQAAISTALGAGYAELTVENGRLKPVRDEVRTVFEHAYSPQNMLSGGLGRQFKSPRPDDIDGVEVDYLDTETWTRKTVICTLPGSLRTRLKKIKIDGVGDKTRAWRAGMRELRQEKYRIWGYSFSTELDAMCSSYLSYVPIYDDIPKYMQTAMVEGSTSTAGVTYITISEAVKYDEYGAAATLVCAMRRRDGTSTEFMTIERDTSLAPNVVKIPAAEYAKLPEQLKQATYNHDLGTGEPLHIFVGIANRLCFPALIVDISPSGYNKTNVKAVNYDPRVYADDDNQPPLDA